jgi:hypothetical protein
MGNLKRNRDEKVQALNSRQSAGQFGYKGIFQERINEGLNWESVGHLMEVAECHTLTTTDYLGNGEPVTAFEQRIE